jgi:murein DD-endopeptidase MepM/ murein hydrolase activator NlpD
MPTTAQLVEKLPTTESRGEALLDAKKKRLEQETRLGQVRHRVGLLADEAERIKREIEEAKARTRERMELAERTDAIKKVGSQTRAWVDAELEERRKAVAEQRKVAKQAIEAKRLAILEARHADFVAKKQEAAKMRITIINARAMKQQQKKTQMEFVRAQSVTARQRMKTFEEERQKAISSHFAVDRLQEEAEARESMAQIQRLAKEEERLLSAVVQQHAKHRSEFDSLMKAKPAYARGLTPNPAPLGLTPPLSPRSIILERRPATASGVLQSQRPHPAVRSAAVPSTPISSSRSARASGEFGNSGAIRSAYGNSEAPGSARVAMTPRPPSAGSARGAGPSRPGSRPGSARAVNAIPMAPGAICAFSSPRSAPSSRATTSRPGSAKGGAHPG